MQAIRTKRLLLRDFKEIDWRDVHEYASDREVVRYMDWGPNTPEETRRFIKRASATRKRRPRHVYSLAMVSKSEDKVIGGCGINVSNPENREGWLGYCLNRRYWGRGYATETAKALIGFGFGQLNLHRIFATCDPNNTRSARVLEKAGMKWEGHIREHKWAKGKWCDSLLYAVLEPKWKNRFPDFSSSRPEANRISNLQHNEPLTTNEPR